VWKTHAHAKMSRCQKANQRVCTRRPPHTPHTVDSHQTLPQNPPLCSQLTQRPCFPPLQKEATLVNDVREVLRFAEKNQAVGAATTE
jgi:hypothetical protein